MKNKLFRSLAFVVVGFLAWSCELGLQEPVPIKTPISSAPKGGGTTLFAGFSAQQITNLPQYKTGAVAFTIAEKFAFVGTGYNANPTTGVLVPSVDFWKYDPTTDSWTQVADFPGAGRAFATAFSINTKGYVGTGQGASTWFCDFYEYNYNTNTWTQRNKVPGGLRHGATGFSIGTKGFIATGAVQGYMNDLWEYDPAADTWTKKADLPGASRMLAGSFVIDGRGYLGAGFLNNSPLSDFWRYDPLVDEWTRVASLGSDSMPGHSGFFRVGKNGYVGGNQQLWMYEPPLDTWTKIAEFPDEMYVGVGFSLLGKYGYIGSGSRPQNSLNMNTFYRYSF